MTQVPVISLRDEVTREIGRVMTESDIAWELVPFSNPDEYLEYLSFETPEVLIIDFSREELSPFGILDAISSDTWLNCSGIIAVHDAEEEAFLEQTKRSNLIAAVTYSDVTRKLAGILDIVGHNRHILFQRELQNTFIGESSGTFEIPNNLAKASVYSNLIVNYIYNLNYIGSSRKLDMRLALQEMLINAIEHGNCGISYDEKTRLTMEEGLIGDEMLQKRLREYPEFAARRVMLEYNIQNTRTLITIRDEGDGFDWRNMLSRKAENSDGEQLLHGRGITLTKNVVDQLWYNEQGNEVTVIIKHYPKQKHKLPALFEAGSETRVKPGNTVFHEEESSDYLYYIASGSYRVYDRQGQLAVLTQNDLFMGEMSFLLNNKRTATVEARTEGVLYRISKKKFIEAIKQYPYYSFLLCKILARRLENQNQNKNTDTQKTPRSRATWRIKSLRQEG